MVIQEIDSLREQRPGMVRAEQAAQPEVLADVSAPTLNFCIRGSRDNLNIADYLISDY